MRSGEVLVPCAPTPEPGGRRGPGSSVDQLQEELAAGRGTSGRPRPACRKCLGHWPHALGLVPQLPWRPCAPRAALHVRGMYHLQHHHLSHPQSTPFPTCLMKYPAYVLHCKLQWLCPASFASSM